MGNQLDLNKISTRKRIGNFLVHLLLAVLALIWVLPIVWIVLTSFRAEPGAYTKTFLPQGYTINNYVKLLTDRNVLNFPKMFMNTLIISICSCIVSTFFVLSVAYSLSRMRFAFRKTYMNLAMILGLFPGFMTMIAQYFILKAMGLTEGSSIRLGLILVYCACTGLGFQISKGFFDTIPRSIDEAAIMDGATQWQVFRRITMPHLHGHDGVYRAVGRLHLCEGPVQGERGPVHGRHRPVEHAAEGVHLPVVHVLCCRRGADLHTDRHPVPLHAEVLRGRYVWSGKRMKNVQRTICAILCMLLCVSGCTAEKAAGGKSAASSAQMIDYNKDLARAERNDRYRTTYEIFVYSFCDSNGDGIGDLNGIRSKLDYIGDLGFDALWLTPVHPSSTYHKYDVDDYCAIDPKFGTMEDYEALLRECHERGMRVYLDLVLNHTSSNHAWFRAAADYLRSLPSGGEPDASACKYLDYYHFQRGPADGYAPLDGTEWYYEARFWSEMPDLNLDSEAVRGEIRDIMAFWLGKGVDGFRLDAVTSYYTGDPAANAAFLRFVTEAGRSIDPDCYFVGEAWTDRASIAELYAGGIDSLFDFPFANNEGFIANIIKGSYKASDYVKGMLLAEEAYGKANPDYVDAPFYTNHDMGRSAGYYAADDGPITKMAYAMSLFMTGNSFVYYGEEIGMKGAGKDENKRAPMYWSDNADDPDLCAGPPDMDDVAMKFPSLEDQMQDDLSLWRWFKEVIRVRNAFPQIARGVTEDVPSVSDENVAAFFRRSSTDGDLLIVMNLRGETAEKDLGQAGGSFALAAVLNTNEEEITYQDGTVTLPAYSIAVFTVP